MITLQDITTDNFDQCLALAVHDDQKDFVATNANSLAHAWLFPKAAKPFAIYNNDEMVGFIMLDLDSDYDGTGKVFLWRLMIDKAHQNKGYGKAAMELALKYVKDNCKVKVMRTSVVPGNDHATKLYKSLGFVETGEIEHGENVMVLSF